MYECSNCHSFNAHLIPATITKEAIVECPICGYNEETEYYLIKPEIKLLWQFLSHQHIGYENLELIELVRKISSIANEEE